MSASRFLRNASATLRINIGHTPLGRAATAAVVQTAIDDGLAKSYGYFGLGAVEDGVTSSQFSRLLDALQSGFVVDLEGLTFNFDGDLRPSTGSFKGLMNGRLKLGTPGAVHRALFLRDQAGFVLRKIEVIGTGVYTSGDIENHGLIWIDGSSDFDVVEAKASKGGPGNGIAVLSCDAFSIRSPQVRDLNYDLPVATDDVINGIRVNNCKQFSVTDPRVMDFTGKIAGSASKRFTRGLALAGNSRFTVIGGMNRNVDQGIDLTGSVGNRHFVIGNHVSYQNDTWGFKCANTAQEGSILGCTSILAGGAGFVISPASEPSIAAANETQNLRISDCRAINPGGSPAFGNWAGLAIIAGHNKPDYPQGIRVDHFTAIDDRGAGALMRYGAVNEIPHPGVVGFRRNTISGLESQGHTIAPQQGFHELSVRAIGEDVASIADSTWTSVDYSAPDIEDSSAMHNPASNADTVFIWEDGVYSIAGNVVFAPDPKGMRGARLQASGEVMAGSTELIAAIATAGTETSVQTSATIRLSAGRYIKLECFQNRGSALNIHRAASRLAVRKIAD
ncbi:hypothetical protein ASG25_03210 [Rhizobium sp. Leaf384]|nr:hypothetical protein ASG03_04455 [Rhizobium sp. Leaf341]KQS80597.1 hypothetical protein ASG25_03210 [Rhizobium sp. Leaf384]KQS82535.1 hypothetical protein ASG58_04025 [Rhizobium sp. Leaf383]